MKRKISNKTWKEGQRIEKSRKILSKFGDSIMDFIIDKDYIITDITNGDTVGNIFETREKAEEWIKNQDIPERYEIIERE